MRKSAENLLEDILWITEELGDLSPALGCLVLVTPLIGLSVLALWVRSQPPGPPQAIALVGAICAVVGVLILVAGLVSRQADRVAARIAVIRDSPEIQRAIKDVYASQRKRSKLFSGLAFLSLLLAVAGWLFAQPAIRWIVTAGLALTMLIGVLGSWLNQRCPVCGHLVQRQIPPGVTCRSCGVQLVDD